MNVVRRISKSVKRTRRRTWKSVVQGEPAKTNSGKVGGAGKCRARRGRGAAVYCGKRRRKRRGAGSAGTSAFLKPEGAIERFVERLVHHKFGFQLENLRGFVSAAVFFFRSAFCTAGVSCFRFGAATGHRGLFFGSAGAFGNKQGNSHFAHAVAVDLLRADADGGGEERGHPNPSERFFYAGRHFFC